MENFVTLERHAPYDSILCPSKYWLQWYINRGRKRGKRKKRNAKEEIDPRRESERQTREEKEYNTLSLNWILAAKPVSLLRFIDPPSSVCMRRRRIIKSGTSATYVSLHKPSGWIKVVLRWPTKLTEAMSKSKAIMQRKRDGLGGERDVGITMHMSLLELGYECNVSLMYDASCWIANIKRRCCRFPLYLFSYIKRSVAGCAVGM